MVALSYLCNISKKQAKKELLSYLLENVDENESGLNEAVINGKLQRNSNYQKIWTLFKKNKQGDCLALLFCDFYPV